MQLGPERAVHGSCKPPVNDPFTAAPMRHCEFRPAPRIAWRVPELDDNDVRQRLVYSYRLIYRIHEAEQGIEMLAVIHCARLLPDDVRARF